jgi:hypothetical protein
MRLRKPRWQSAPVRRGHSCSLKFGEVPGGGYQPGSNGEIRCSLLFLNLEGKKIAPRKPSTGFNSAWTPSHSQDAKMTQLVMLPTKSATNYPSESKALWLLRSTEVLKTKCDPKIRTHPIVTSGPGRKNANIIRIRSSQTSSDNGEEGTTHAETEGFFID